MTGTTTRPPSARHGLTQAEADERQRRFGRNVLPPPNRPPLAVRLARELREPMALLLIIAAAVSGLVLREAVEAVAIIAVVVLDAIIALVQEGRAVRALDALTALEPRSTIVVRDGRPRSVDVADVVPDDLVRLAAGDRVPADLELVRARALEVDEAVLTGESLPVTRTAPAALHAGTLVLRGNGLGTVTATGADTMLGSIAAELQDARREPTPLQVRLTRLTRTLGIVATALAGGTLVLLLLANRGTSVEDAFLTAVALAVAAVPEGLAAVTTVALALGVRRMAQHGAIVRHLPAVETLGSADVLVIDKTGTVTRNRMEATAVVTPDGSAYGPADLPPSVRAVVEPVIALCNDATLAPPTGDPTERALLAVVAPAQVDRLRDRWPRLAEGDFTSDRRRMSTVHELEDGPTLLLKGAPEVVLDRCSSRSVGGRVEPLSETVRDRLLVDAAERAERGERVLACASRQLPSVPAEPEEEEHGLTLLALVALRDPLRDSAPDSVTAVREAGATLLMATGDHPGTAAAVGREIGLDGDVLTGDQLRRDGLPDDPTTTSIYARVDPTQKLDLVQRLQDDGHVVAMTGDGVNDAPALRRADIGVALGETGSDVAREAADLVITDDDLATIVTAIGEGRGIDDNLRKVVHYLVTSNLAEVAVVLLTLATVASLDVPLHPLQLLWINLLTDGLPALALGVDPPDPTLLRRPPRERHAQLLTGRVLRRLAAAALTLTAGAMTSLWVALEVLGASPTTAQTILFSTLVVGQIAYAYVVHQGRDGNGIPSHGPRRNPWLHAAALTALALQGLVVHVAPLGTVFDTVPLGLVEWGVVAAGGILPAVLLALVTTGRGLRASSAARAATARTGG